MADNSSKFPDMDIYCQIVDNYGDIGFCRGLMAMYQKRHPEVQVRLFVDGAPEAPEKSAPLVVETFGCEIPNAHMEKVRSDAQLWLNVEYLTAEKWIEDCHGKESPQNLPGPRKFFFMPGFSPKSGGVITDFEAKAEDKNLVSIFTYDQDFTALFEACNSEDSLEFLVFDKYSQKKLTDCPPDLPQHKVVMSPFVSPAEYDQILASAKLNLVRGEVSFVRAILAGKPFLWQAYIQKEDLHITKVEAFLDVFGEYWTDKVLFELYKGMMLSWNGNGEAISVDNWRIFLENLPAIGAYTRNFGDYLRHECDLGEHFDEFIKQKYCEEL